MSEFTDKKPAAANVEEEQIHATYTAHVISSEKFRNDDGKQYVAYNVEVKSTEGDQWILQKRYSEFLELFKAIKDKYEIEAIEKFEFPKKDLFFSEAPDVLEKRRNAFDEFCQILLSLPLDRPVEVAKFLRLPHPAEEGDAAGVAATQGKAELETWLGEKSQELFVKKSDGSMKNESRNSGQKEASLEIDGVEKPSDEQIADFIAVTGADPSIAMHLLEAHSGNLEAALASYTETGGSLIGVGEEGDAPLTAAAPEVVQEGETPKDDDARDPQSNDTESATATSNPPRTEADKERALALLRLSGLQSGETIIVDEDNIPGMQMFQISKMILSGNPEDTPEEILWSLILTSDRLLLVEPLWLHEHTEAPWATVHLNNHLSQVVQIKSSTEDEDIVTLFFQHGTMGEDGSSSSSQIFWIPGREAFIQALEKCLQQFGIELGHGKDKEKMGNKRASTGRLKGIFQNIQKDMQKVQKDVQQNLSKMKI